MLTRSSSKMRFIFILLLLDCAFSQDASQTIGSEEFIPCDEGWYYFRERCFKAVGKIRLDRRSWFDAETNCKAEGGFLASIRSHEENDFLVTFLLLDIETFAWVGFNDLAEEGVYKWNDGIPNNYTNWRWEEPTYPNENCGLMLYQPETEYTGTLSDVICSHIHGYMCHKNINTEKRSPNPLYCLSNGRRGVKHGSSCYHVVTEKETWQDAEQQCKDKFDGHLVTILDSPADMLLDYLLDSNHDKDIWIGINTYARPPLKWAAGWYVVYNGLNTKHEKVEGTCVIRKTRKEWVLALCAEKHSFVCERAEVKAPVLKSPPISHCPEVPDGWSDLGGEYCYFIELQSHLSWYEAKFDCTRRGGNLVSIHSKEEKDVLVPFVVSQNKDIHLGLVRLLSMEFAWSDGSARDYENWAEGEPNNPEKKCSQINAFDGTWTDAICNENLPYICSVRKIMQNGTGKVSEITDSGDLVLKFVIGISVCIALVVFLLGLTVYYFRQWALERRKNSLAVRVTPPPIWTISSRQWARDDGYIYKDDDNYEIMH